MTSRRSLQANRDQILESKIGLEELYETEDRAPHKLFELRLA